MHKKPQIALHGAVYGENFGDVLISQILADHVRKATGADVFFPFGRKAFAAVSKEQTGRIWKLAFAKTAIMGPGGYFGERRHDQAAWNNRFQFYHGNFFRLVKLLRRPLILHGVGVGPLSDPISRALARRIFDYSGLINVRDQKSKDYVLDLGISEHKVNIYPDVALTLMPENVTSTKLTFETCTRDTSSKKVIGLHLPLPEAFSADVFENIVYQVRDMISSHLDFRFVILRDGPRQIIHPDIVTVIQGSNRSEDKPYSNPKGLLHDIAHCNAVVTTKLHVGICAAALGVAPISLYSHPKVQRFFQDIGRDEFCQDIMTAPPGWLGTRFELERVFTDAKFLDQVDILRNASQQGLDTLTAKIQDAAGTAR